MLVKSYLEKLFLHTGDRPANVLRKQLTNSHTDSLKKRDRISFMIKMIH